MISNQIYIDAHTRQKNNSNNNIFSWKKRIIEWLIGRSFIVVYFVLVAFFINDTLHTHHHHWFDQIRSCGFFFLSLAIITHCYIHYILGWFDPTVDHHHRLHGLYIFYIIIWIEKKLQISSSQIESA